MKPTRCSRIVREFEDIDHICEKIKPPNSASACKRLVRNRTPTKVLDIKHFRTTLYFIPSSSLPSSIRSQNCRTLAIVTHSNMYNRCQMRSIQLDKLYSDCLFLPELEYTVLRCSQDEIGSRGGKREINRGMGGDGRGGKTHFVTAI